jgi:hypothetical protein
MKQEIYKKNFERYESIVYKDTLPININSLTKEEDFMVVNYSKPTKKHPLFILKVSKIYKWKNYILLF